MGKEEVLIWVRCGEGAGDQELLRGVVLYCNGFEHTSRWLEVVLDVWKWDVQRKVAGLLQENVA